MRKLLASVFAVAIAVVFMFGTYAIADTPAADKAKAEEKMDKAKAKADKKKAEAEEKAAKH